MQIKLKEDPKEWRKFTLQVCGVLGLLSAFLTWRGAIPIAVLPGLLALWLVTALTALARPRWFRAFYRGGMLTSAWLGEWMGRAFLLVFFFAAILPLGCILRWLGHDPLALKKRPGTSSYWHPADKPRKLDKMF